MYKYGEKSRLPWIVFLTTIIGRNSTVEVHGFQIFDLKGQATGYANGQKSEISSNVSVTITIITDIRYGT